MLAWHLSLITFRAEDCCGHYGLTYATNCRHYCRCVSSKIQCFPIRPYLFPHWQKVFTHGSSQQLPSVLLHSCTYSTEYYTRVIVFWFLAHYRPDEHHHRIPSSPHWTYLLRHKPTFFNDIIALRLAPIIFEYTFSLVPSTKEVKILLRQTATTTMPTKATERVASEVAVMAKPCLNCEQTHFDTMYRAQKNALRRSLFKVLGEPLEHVILTFAKR